MALPTSISISDRPKPLLGVAAMVMVSTDDLQSSPYSTHLSEGRIPRAAV